jgi:hypothetical protein
VGRITGKENVMTTSSIPVYAQLYRDYGCQCALELSFECHGKEFKVDGVSVYAEYYRCNQHGIAVYDGDFKLLKVAPMQHYHVSKESAPRYYLMHVHDSNLLHLIETAKMTEVVIPTTCAVPRY